MLFNSFIFWIFLSIVVLIYYRLSHRSQNLFLLVASYIFYGSWNWKFLSLILISTCIDYFVGRRLSQATSDKVRKSLLLLSVATNLGFLGIFKYYNFFIEQFISLNQELGFHADISLLEVVLPVGISFYTFQTMSYTIDVYRGIVKPEKRFTDFALYVCFFPQLVAGPIERFNRLMPQIRNRRVWQPENFVEGLYHVIIGLFKKIVIADNMAPIVNAVFNTPAEQLTGIECFLGVLAFAFQIYGDFSGYSSIAQGVARWLGFELMYNFKMPYFASSPSDFWKRWHISLSGWLRDYLYFPLGGNRYGSFRTYRNLLLTMALGGLWHGAGWTFILWGVYHGVILCFYRLVENLRSAEKGVPSELAKWSKIPSMFVLTLLGWLLFRAKSVDQVFGFLGRVTSPLEITPLSIYMASMIGFFTLPLMAYEFLLYRRGNDMLWLIRQPWYCRALVYGYFIYMILFFTSQQSQEFIYFQF
jgi:alginate O-acetyltransferase complex protein AlgI